ncbi:MAG TPA: bifunctional UDP-N-acetylglucosamine diphosphorylase/glucosamine-1-phosphate N-acetyltransferase GlmU [Fimbriimonadaceae bacterium]|nr:bifunctional UDP-N-acetylglucosamine diphosphorylase/glucosamine-1-phosphate N-acetyltransferase GlmU [Fimbriimonadaceae bacterium]
MSQSPLAGVILAAGKGTRMKSENPKGLHAVCGVPMAGLIGRALKDAGVERPIVVVGHRGDLLVQALGESFDFAWQHEQLGTGHAARVASDLLAGKEGEVLITPGDTPLLQASTLAALVEAHRASGASCTVATVMMADATGYGRVIRDGSGAVSKIVEHKDATAEEREVREINTGIFCFGVRLLLDLLPKLGNQNAQGEYYLTDTVEAINAAGGKVAAFVFPDADEAMGVNDRWQLAEAEKALRRRLLRNHALNGVTILDPDSTFVGMDVEIGADTVIEPLTSITGATVIGSDCRIGPSTKIANSTIGDSCTVLMSHVSGATMLDGSRCGPFANLRPGSVLGEKVKIGNFVEIKNASLGAGSAVSHLSYIGDGVVGERTNIGAGTIFCNNDGFGKHKTEIGSGVFVGSNSTLVAPVTIEDGAMVAAGSVITSNVPENALAIGRGRQENKEEWAAQWRKKKQS